MGGNAIKVKGKSITGRLSAAAYKKVRAFVLDALKPHVETAECVLEAPGKASFGDIDVLYVRDAKDHPGQASDMKNVVFDVFNLEQMSHIVRHGPVMSFALPKAAFELAVIDGECDTDAELLVADLPNYFQVDLIHVSDLNHLATSRFYYAYSDVGGILGRIFNYYGLKLGEAGVWCEVFQQTVEAFEDKKASVSADASAKSENKKPTVADDDEPLLECNHKDLTRVTIGKLMLTKDPREICAFAGLDHDAFFNEMHTVEDIHKWIAKSTLFKQEIFHTLNYQNRRRAIERPMYINFLKHIGINQGVGDDEGVKQEALAEAAVGGASEDVNPIFVIGSMASQMHTVQRSSEIKCNMQLQAIKHFNAEEEFLDMVKRNRMKRERQAKFNGTKLISGFQHRDEEHGGAKKVSGKEVATLLAAFKKHCLVSLLGDDEIHQKMLGAAAAAVPSDKQLEPLFEKYLDAFEADEIDMHLKMWINEQ